MLKPKKTKEAEAAAPAEGEEGAVAAKKKPPMMLILIGAGVLVLLLGGGGAAFFLMQPPKSGAEAKAPEKKKEESKDKKKDDKKGPADPTAGVVRAGPNGLSYYTMPDLVENLQVPDGRPTFLKLKLTFEISDPDALDLVQQQTPRLHDMFTGFLRELRPDDLAGSQGTYELKAEILRRVNLVLAPHKVDQVLIEEMLVQ